MRHLKYILLGILMGLSFCAEEVSAQKVILFDEDSTVVTIPSFKENFEVLRKNRILYNAYNDSIFLIHDHDRWVNFFRRRALKNQQIHLANKIALANIFDYFKQDSIPSIAYTKLVESFWSSNIRYEVADPFLVIEVYGVLQEFYNCCPDSLNLSNAINIWQGVAYSNVANVTKGNFYWAKSAECLKRVLTDKAKVLPLYSENYPMALWNLSKNVFLVNKVITIQEHNEYFTKLKKWYQEYKDSDIIGDANLKAIKRFIASHDENIIRNVYMNDTTVMNNQIAEALISKIIKRNLSNKDLTYNSFLRTLIMQEHLKQISAKQAVKLALTRYREEWKDLKKRRFTSGQLSDFLMPFYSFFYLNDISNASFSRKRSIVRKMCADIEQAYQQREDQQRNNYYVKHLNQFTTYPRITKYLKPAERVHFLNTLNVATQVTTYAHSVHVSIIAEELMKGILEYQPELLVGSLGDLQVSEIQRKRNKYLEFIHDAGLYHDIGKNTIASVVNNDYRPLTDLEFSIIKEHPDMGLQYLELSPKLMKYRDTMLGHHKWYNGKGGYPASFDKTKSRQRIMIDIVTLSDCLQAATERIGRNYKGDKTFDTVMAEFRKDAGTRYNPDLVTLIDEHPDLAKKLADLIDDGWIEIYYNIYSQYFGK